MRFTPLSRVFLVALCITLPAASQADGPAGSDDEIQIKSGSSFGAITAGDDGEVLQHSTSGPIWRAFGMIPKQKLTVNDDLVADDPATADLTVSQTYHYVDCKDPDGCEITVLHDAGYETNGQIVFIANFKTNLVTVKDGTGNIFLGGDVPLKQNETVALFRSGGQWHVLALGTDAAEARAHGPVVLAEWLIVLDQDITDDDSFPALNRVRGDAAVTSLECAINASSGSHDIDFMVCLGADHTDESCGADEIAELTAVTGHKNTDLVTPYEITDHDRLTLLTEVNSGSATAAHCIAWGVER